MHIEVITQVEEAILNAVHRGERNRIDDIIRRHRLDLLPILGQYLSQDMPIEILEKFEGIFKEVLRTSLSGAISGEDARQIASFQKDIGFLLKYKSYAIKASSPLGYSVFFQNPREGFSFQQHVTYKTEVFHILEVSDNGYVFICDFKDWNRIYQKESFAAWLAGHPDERYDQYRFEPNPGDVFAIDKLGVVHSVFGCMIEEFATVSNDAADRLHDQNAGKPIPEYFNRYYAEERLKDIPSPFESRRVEIHSHRQRVTRIDPIRIVGGRMIPLTQTPVRASRYIIEPSQSGELKKDDLHVTSIYIIQGNGQIIMGEHEEVNRMSPPSITVRAGDLLIVPRGVYNRFVNEGSNPLIFSEHKIPFKVAFA